MRRAAGSGASGSGKRKNEEKEEDPPSAKTQKGVQEEKEGKKPPSKAPKIQRLVTPISLQRKRHRLSLKKNQQLKAKAEAAAYEKLVAQRKQEAREKHNEKVSQRRSARSSRASEE